MLQADLVYNLFEYLTGISRDVFGNLEKVNYHGFQSLLRSLDLVVRPWGSWKQSNITDLPRQGGMSLINLQKVISPAQSRGLKSTQSCFKEHLHVQHKSCRCTELDIRKDGLLAVGNINHDLSRLHHYKFLSPEEINEVFQIFYMKASYVTINC